jgi:hypothetical protein
MNERDSTLGRLVTNWVYGGALAGIVLACLTPVLTAGWPLWLKLTYLHLPAYMLHQLEEHDADRFRRFFNETLGHGREILSPTIVFVINVPGVWGIIAAALALARFGDAGWALIAVYLLLVNAIVHLLHATAFRRYNPGLITAVTVFLPLSFATMRPLHHEGADLWRFHALGLGAALALHAAIAWWVSRAPAALGAR